MNGRLYDPMLHRFLQPNNIQDPYNTQNYNRYGYVLNNPLKYTDPSGEAGDYPGNGYECKGCGYNNGSNNNGFEGGYEGQVGGNIFKSVAEFFKNPENAAWVRRNVGEAGRFVGRNAQSAARFVGRNVKSIGNWIGGWFGHKSREAAPIAIPQFQANGPSPNVGNIGTNNYFGGGSNATISQYNGYSGIPANSSGNYDNSKTAIDIGGGIYEALGSTTASGGKWLGKNGKYYSELWGGNGATGSRAGAFKAASNYKWAGRTAIGANAIIGGLETYNGYQLDGGHFGYNAQFAAASSAGGLIGGYVGSVEGAAIGASIGVWFGGVGAVPGAVIGGFIGGFGGGYLGSVAGEGAVNYIHK